MKYRGYFYVGFATTLNILLNALTFGHFLWLEGRVLNGVFRNWGRRFRYRPHLEKLYSTYFTKFLQIRDQQDPQRKFTNVFTRRLFGA